MNSQEKERLRKKLCSWCRIDHPVSNGGYHRDCTNRLVQCRAFGAVCEYEKSEAAKAEGGDDEN